MEIGEIVGLLNARAETLAQHLLPNGHREGDEWVELSTSKGGLGDSLRVRIRGSRSGVWAHFAGGPEARGDALDLIAYIQHGGDKSAALKWARAWLGIDNADPAKLEEQRKRLVIAQKAQKDAEERERKKITEIAFRLFLNSQPKILGTPAELYLKGRGIDIRALGKQPGCLRFHPALTNRDTGRTWPALIAAITAPDNKMVAVHRTWLEVQSTGRVTKAPVENAKMTLGTYRGGCIRLWRGADGKQLDKAPAGSSALVSEGIEDGLTAVLAKPEQRVLVAVSLSNMASLWLPSTIERITILAQNDTKPAAIAALDRVISHHLAEGRRVLLARPEASVKDVNDLLQQGAK